MSTSTAFDVAGRSREIAAYERGPNFRRRPLLTMLAGLLLAAVAAVLCALLARDIWYERSVPVDSGLFGVSLLFCFYVGGVFIFALGYELYDVPRALRFTIVLAILGLLALVFMIAALIALAVVKHGAAIAVSEKQRGQVLGALGYLGAGESDDGPAKAEPNPHFSMITCAHCERQFFPVPPDAICPWCDTPYLTTRTESSGIVP